MSKNNKIVLWVVVGVVILCLCTISLIVLAITQIPGLLDLTSPSGRIIYVSDQSGNYQLFSMDLHNGNMVRLTNDSVNYSSPTYIKATDQIGFISDGQNGMTLHVADTYAEQMTSLIHEEGLIIDYPGWSPDGTSIAASMNSNCTPDASSCFYDIYVMDADGSHRVQLTNTIVSEWVPVWSPDGERILFESDLDGDSEIYVMNRDGSQQVQLTKNNGYDGTPRWSPDGLTIAFDTDRDGGDWDVYLMNADGTNPRPLTRNTNNDFSECWSPDGKWLVYVSDIDGDNELFIIRKDGTDQKRLTRNLDNDFAPIWIPNELLDIFSWFK